jgi:putative ABC transport system permease protein
MESLLADIRYGLRSIRRSPGVIAVAILSLGLGIGANVTIFSAVDVFMLRPLPYPDADRLVHVYSTVPERGWTYNVVSIPDFLDFREQSHTVDLAVSYGHDVNLSGSERPERIDGERASWNYFQVLRVAPQLGRAFTPEEERAGNDRVAIISDGLWHRTFGGDPAILGTKLLLDGVPHTIVGVLPPRFRFSQDRTDIWTPLGLTGDESRGSHFLSPVGRLRPGATLERANAEMAAIAGRLAQTYPETNQGWGAGARELRRQIFSDEFRMGSLISTVAVAFVLLIACANVANLMLARVAGRTREITLRGALGAGRGRIARQLLTESMLLSIAGGVLGLGLSVIGIRGLVALMPAWFPRVDEIGINLRVLGFAALITIATGVIFGMAPALQTARLNFNDALKEAGRGSVGPGGHRLRRILVVAEVALALVLLVSSALLVQGFLRLQTADYGWDKEHLLIFRLALPRAEYQDDAAVTAFYRELLPALSAIPGVESVGGTSVLPMQGNSNSFFEIPGRDIGSLRERPLTEVRTVFPGYLTAMGTALLKGRAFGDQDLPDAPPVVIVNQALAERYWPDEDPIGRQLLLWDDTRTVVGVARNTLDNGPYPRPMTFLSAFQNPRWNMALVVRTRGEPSALADRVRAAVLGLDHNLPIYGVTTMKNMMKEERGGDTIMAKIMAVVAAVALVLAVVGVYGVMAYSISQRTREMGIRMALGAQQGNVRALVIRQGAVLAAIGIAAGVGIALLVTRSLATFLFGVSPFDPVVFGAVALVLLASSLGATYFPARRATQVSPIEALRAE